MARITNANGDGPPTNPAAVSVISELGSARPRSGNLMLALSTGAPAGSTTCDDLWIDFGERVPEGLNLNSGCFDLPISEARPVFNAVALEVELRVPTNVSGYQLASHFFTHEYPAYVCTEFNDVFAVLQGRDGVLENVVFDSEGNPITVNNALLRACESGTHQGQYYACELGRGPLRGTGFESEVCLGEEELRNAPSTGAGTGCIQTVSRVNAGETIRLRFVVWDTSDDALDSLALIDGFSWVPDRFESVAP